jgi:hypothetical protein
MEESYLLSMRCPVYRRRDSNTGSRAELETLVGDGKGKGTSGETMRSKVPMRPPGSDCSIVALNRGNARAAKGAGHPRWDLFESTGNRRNSLGLDGRRRLSNGGTGRISREANVQLCEPLGVRIPGLTRRPQPELWRSSEGSRISRLARPAPHQTPSGGRFNADSLPEP